MALKYTDTVTTELDQLILRFAMTHARRQSTRFERHIAALYRVERDLPIVAELCGGVPEANERLKGRLMDLADPFQQAVSLTMRVEAECEMRLGLPPTKRTRHLR